VSPPVGGDIVSQLQKKYNEEKLAARIAQLQEEAQRRIAPMADLEKRWKQLKGDIETRESQLRDVEQQLRQGMVDVEGIMSRKNQLMRMKLDRKF
jgi:predicted nuclease with TOPRIM domain